MGWAGRRGAPALLLRCGSQAGTWWQHRLIVMTGIQDWIADLAVSGLLMTHHLMSQVYSVVHFDPPWHRYGFAIRGTWLSHLRHNTNMYPDPFKVVLPNFEQCQKLALGAPGRHTVPVMSTWYGSQYKEEQEIMPEDKLSSEHLRILLAAYQEANLNWKFTTWWAYMECPV